MDVASLSSGSIPLLSALGLGLLTAISPCTMATNVAALAYVGRRASQQSYAALTALLYTLGRIFTYTAIGILIVLVGMEVSVLSRSLQAAGSAFLGPFLIAVGILFLVIEKLPAVAGGGHLQRLGNRLGAMGVLGGFPLGALFALAFCPYSAVLFFAVLIPLALRTAEGFAMPGMFAIGTGIPVLVFGAVLSFGTARAATLMNALSRAERVMRIVVAAIFIAAGVYCLFVM